MKSAECPECHSTRLLYTGGTLTCSNCDYVIGKRMNKYGAKRTKSRDGVVRDSKFEASVADELDLRKRAGEILDYDSQYKVEIPVCRQDGAVAFTVKHKVDFRLHLKDGSYELLEAKGAVTTDYMWRRKFLELIWLPAHPDHTYTVIKQHVKSPRRTRR